MASNLVNIPGLSATQPITKDGVPASQTFLTWFNSAIEALQAATNSNTNTLALVIQQQNALNAALLSIQSSQAVATTAQTTADTATGSGQSGSNQNTVTIATTAYTVVATVPLTGVVAGNLTIFGTQINNNYSTDVEPEGFYSANWRVVENPGSIVRYNGTYSFSRQIVNDFGGLALVTVYTIDDLSQVSIPCVTTGSISYDLEVQGAPGATITGAIAYLNVRRA